MPKPTSLSALIKASASPADRKAPPQTKAPLRAAAHAPMPGGAAAVTTVSTGSIKTTIVYYPWDMERIEEAQKLLRQHGRKAERTLTVRALIHHALLNEGFIARYDEAEKNDARRGVKAGREGGK